MRVIIQRVSRASVKVEGRVIGRIGAGLLALVGLAPGDGESHLDAMADKMVNLRIFADGEGKMNLSLLDSGGAILAVSQFTLHADCRRGRRPSFMGAAPPETAAPLMDAFVKKLKARGVVVETGQFGAMMDVELVNDGPVTIILDSDELGIH